MSGSSGVAVHVGAPPPDFSIEEVQLVHFHNFMSLATVKNSAVYSPKFTCAGTKWKLKVYPGGDSESERGMVAVYLISMSTSKIAVNFSVKIKKANGDNLDKSRGEFSQEHDIFVNKYVSWGWPDYIARDDLFWYSDRILQHGTLTFEVRIRPHPDTYCHTSITYNSRPSDEIQKQFLNSQFADVAFKVKSQIFPAHRIILRCFAPELAELCELHTADNPMSIDDVEPGIFQTMLGTVYGANIDASVWKVNCSSILPAAGKYGFQTLQIEAEGWYMKYLKLNSDNVIDNLMYADGNNLLLLKKAAMEYIVEHCEEVVGSYSYTECLKKSPDLMDEVVQALSKKLSASRKRMREE